MNDEPMGVLDASAPGSVERMTAGVSEGVGRSPLSGGDDLQAWPLVDIGLPDTADIPNLLSVVIPTYNRSGSLSKAVESALRQGHQPIEVIVADDGSTDDSRAVATALGATVRYVRQENRGVAAARNLGLRHARGEFIAFLDSDDLWLPWKAAAEVAVLQAHPEVGMVWTDMAAVDERGRILEDRHLRTFYHAYRTVRLEEVMTTTERLADIWRDVPAEQADTRVWSGRMFNAMLLGNMVHTSTAMLRRRWLRQIGGFDERLRHSGEDYDFHLRTTSLGPVALVDASAVHYRVGAADQLTSRRYMVHMAANDIRTVERALVAPRADVGLERGVIRRRLAGSYAWLGTEELERGNAAAARAALVRSLLRHPVQARTAATLGLALMPRGLRGGLLGLWRGGKRILRRLRGAETEGEGM